MSTSLLFLINDLVLLLKQALVFALVDETGGAIGGDWRRFYEHMTSLSHNKTARRRKTLAQAFQTLMTAVSCLTQKANATYVANTTLIQRRRKYAQAKQGFSAAQPRPS
jgi:hypothetical protein